MINLEVRRPELVKNILHQICGKEAFICGGFARVVCSPCTTPIPSEDIDIYLSDSMEIKARGDEDFENNERDHVLIIKNIHCPIAEVTRISKYTARGYKIPLMQIVRCFLDWEGRDPTYRNELVAALEKDKLTDKDKEELYKRLYVD